MASIKERTDKDGKTRYHVQIRIKGFPPQNGTFKRKTDADRWIQQMESSIREGRHFKTTESKKHTLGQLIDRYIRDVLPSKKKSGQKQLMHLIWWKSQLGHYLLSNISPALIAEKRDFLLRETTRTGKLRSPSTVVRYLAALSHAFTIAIKEWGWMEDSIMNRVTKPKEPRGRVRFLSDEERARLLDVCKESSNPYLYIAVVIALSTGMRQGEIMNLRWSDIDFQKERIILEETKNGERRAVPITGLGLQLLQDLDKVRRIDSVYVFPSKNPKKTIDLRFPWEKALRIADIKDFRWHDLRHCTASYLAMNNASLAEIAEVLGHKTLSMVKRYAHLSEAHTTSVVSKMNEKIFG